jgi:hypothetical protein
MNCFEARQEFRSFWRKELPPGRRTAFVAHLSECAKCDGAFRVFALTAPVLHSDAEPSRPARARRTPARIEGRRSAAWMSIAAVLALFVTGASAAYFSVETSPETLREAVHQPSPFVEMVSADIPGANSDLGQ